MSDETKGGDANCNPKTGHHYICNDAPVSQDAGAQCPKHSGLLEPCVFCERDRLRDEVRELRKDKERLDWLVRHGASVGLKGAWGWYFVQRNPGQNLAQIVSTKGHRAAIDAAMKESQ